jgi:hypothetical protein
MVAGHQVLKSKAQKSKSSGGGVQMLHQSTWGRAREEGASAQTGK